tara:strand:- start:1500 stop:2831 length:1332 start_codon:yes stop_codon:yes gene_type:complete
MSGRERYIELAPSNKTTDNLYSYKRGIAQLNFQIPEGNYLLDPTSVRLCGGIRWWISTAKLAADVPGHTKQQLSVNSRLNVYTCFQQLILRSLTHQTTIEHCRHYNQFLASYLPLTTSMQDNAGHLNESALTFPNYEVNRVTSVNKDKSNHFCVHLPSGVMNGRSIPLARGWGISGLDLTLMLENDAQALHTIDGTTADYTDAFYELDNVKLVCKLIEPPMDQLSQMMKGGGGSLTYQSISSYYDTANSTNMQVNFNLGLSKVRSAFVKIITSDKLNNVGEDGFATLMPTQKTTGALADITQISWLKGGTTFPKHYPLNSNVKDTANTSVADCEITRDYINSVLSFDKLQHLSMTTGNNNRSYVGATASANGTPYQLVRDSGVVYGLGIKYDQLLGEGVDFTSENWGINIDCGMDTANAQSLFIFVNSEQSLVFNAQGVQVVS